MIKSFEQFNSVCEGVQKRKYPIDTDFTDLYCNLDYDCAMCCLDLVNADGVMDVNFTPPIILTIYDNNNGEYKKIKVNKIFVCKQDSTSWKTHKCEKFWDKESGKYLMLQTTDNEEIPVDAGIIDGFLLFDLWSILNKHLLN